MIGLNVFICDGSKYEGRKAKIIRKWMERYDNGKIENLGVIVEIDGMEWGLEHGEYKFN